MGKKAEKQTTSEEKFYRTKVIPISSISIEDRIRDESSDHVNELAVSIAEDGLLTPIAVREISQGNYRLIAGLHRIAACEQLKWNDIQAVIIDKEVPDDELELLLLTIEYTENEKRKPFEYLEKVRAWIRLHEAFISKYGDRRSNVDGWGLSDTANYLGVTKGNLSNAFQVGRAAAHIPIIGKQKNLSTAVRKLEDIRRRDRVAIEAEKVVEKVTKHSPNIQLQELLESYYIGDFIEEVKSVPSNSVNLVECDPPYGIDLLNKSEGDNLTYESYTEIPQSEYPDFISSVISECYRVLSPGGWLIQWYGMDPWHQLILDTLRAAKFKLNGLPGIWSKDKGQTLHPDLYMGNFYETFFYARKGQAFLNKPGRSNIFEYSPIKSKKYHRTQRPIGMMKDLIYTFVGEGATIMVPFLGSGVTLLAASNLKCKAFGWDLSQDHKNGFIVRATEGKLGEYEDERK